MSTLVWAITCQCDLCGRTATNNEPKPDEQGGYMYPPEPPKGWMPNISIGSYTLMTRTFTLCPICNRQQFHEVIAQLNEKHGALKLS